MVSTLFTVVISIVTLAALIGNILVIAAFLKTRSLRTSTNYYIVNMAVSDLICACFNWPLYATEGMLTNTEFITEPLASVVCKLGICFRAISQVVSLLNLALISVDRYAAIVFPVKTTIMSNGTFRVILLLFTWIIPIGVAFPYFVYAKVVKVNNQTFCRVLWNKSAHAIFNAVGFITFYCTPLIIMSILYTLIAKTLRNRPNIDDSVQGRHNSRRRDQQQKIMKILTSIVAGFFICWTPLCVYLALKMFYPALFVKDKCFLLLGLFFYVFPSFSTAINPFILFQFSSNFRQALKSFRIKFFDFNKCRRLLHMPISRVVPANVGNVGMVELRKISVVYKDEEDEEDNNSYNNNNTKQQSGELVVL